MFLELKAFLFLILLQFIELLHIIFGKLDSLLYVSVLIFAFLGEFILFNHLGRLIANRISHCWEGYWILILPNALSFPKFNYTISRGIHFGLINCSQFLLIKHTERRDKHTQLLLLSKAAIIQL